MNIIHPVAV